MRDLLRGLLRGLWICFLIDHVIVDPASGRHYFTWRRL